MILVASIILAVCSLGYLIMAVMIVSGRCARDEEMDARIAEALARWSRRG